MAGVATFGPTVNRGISLTGAMQPNVPAPRPVATPLYDSGNIVSPTGTLGAETAIGGGVSGGGVSVNPNVAQDSAAISNTNKTLATLPQVLQAALDAANNGYTSAEGGLDQAGATAQGQHDTGTVTNQQNYDANTMAALRSGATGLSGLLSILRGTGAEGWANQAVGDTTNSDIRTGLNTRNDNQTSLDTALSGTLTDLAGKRIQNKTTLEGNQNAARSANATQMQDLYTKLAGYYADMGDNGNATTWLNKAGDLAPDVARYAVAPVSSSYASTVPVQAAPVTAFGGPTQQAVTATAADSGANNGIFTIGDTRKRLAGVGA